jgi:AcrR family transcriptional regulator
MAASAPAALPRRRGPRPGGDTRRLLLDVAEQLYAEQGVDAVSLRTVAATAGLASGALHYHFATGDQLLAAVLERRAPSVAARTREMLDSIGVDEAPVTVSAVVDAVLLPWLELLRADREGAPRFIRLVSRLLAAHDVRLSGFLVEVSGEFGALVEQLPDPACRSQVRWEIACDFLVHGLSTGSDPAELRAFVIAGLGGRARDAWTAEVAANRRQSRT